MIGTRLHEGSCPCCGSRDIIETEVTKTSPETYLEDHRCEACGFAWTDVIEKKLKDQISRNSVDARQRLKKIADVLLPDENAAKGFTWEESCQTLSLLTHVLDNARHHYGHAKKSGAKADSPSDPGGL